MERINRTHMEKDQRTHMERINRTHMEKGSTGHIWKGSTGHIFQERESGRIEREIGVEVWIVTPPGEDETLS
jgi:hypothetical protein